MSAWPSARCMSTRDGSRWSTAWHTCVHVTNTKRFMPDHELLMTRCMRRVPRSAWILVGFTWRERRDIMNRAPVVLVLFVLLYVVMQHSYMPGYIKHGRTRAAPGLPARTRTCVIPYHGRAHTLATSPSGPATSTALYTMGPARTPVTGSWIIIYFIWCYIYRLVILLLCFIVYFVCVIFIINDYN